MSVGPGADSPRIPVFASVPSKLDPRQRASQGYIYERLGVFGIGPRTVGGAEPGMYNPLHEVRTLARHCAGGIILGYSQITAKVAHGFKTKANPDGSTYTAPKVIRKYQAPTPWNQLETGILFGLGLPLFVLRQDGISGGIFDEGASDVLVHSMPMPGPQWSADDGTNLVNPRAQQSFEAALLRWQGLVRAHYYGCE